MVGTLGVSGYRGVMARVRQAARAAGKKTYTVLMGKPSPYKLANFPEIEVFVMIADPQVRHFSSPPPLFSPTLCIRGHLYVLSYTV